MSSHLSRKTKSAIALGLAALFGATLAINIAAAHGGGLNSEGCHHDRKRGTYQWASRHFVDILEFYGLLSRHIAY